MISRTPGCAAQSDVFMMKGRDATLVQQRAVNENCEYHLLDGIAGFDGLFTTMHSRILLAYDTRPEKSFGERQVYLTCIKLEGSRVYLARACYFATHTTFTISIVPSSRALRGSGRVADCIISDS